MPTDPSGYLWDAAKGIYRTADGKPVPISVVRGGLQDAAVQAADRMGEASGRLQAGASTVEAWHNEMRGQIESMYRSVHALANGGWANMDEAKWARCEARLQTQMDYLARFASQLASGEQELDGRFALRAEMYASSAHAAFENERRAERTDAGAKWERWVLDISAENCSGCEALDSMGWVPIGTLPEIGSQDCLTNCRCEIEYEFGDEKPD
jgi:hypothetical protein